jgi:hypothetical protein
VTRKKSWQFLSDFLPARKEILSMMPPRIIAVLAALCGATSAFEQGIGMSNATEGFQMLPGCLCVVKCGQVLRSAHKSVSSTKKNKIYPEIPSFPTHVD